MDLKPGVRIAYGRLSFLPGTEIDFPTAQKSSPTSSPRHFMMDLDFSDDHIPISRNRDHLISTKMDPGRFFRGEGWSPGMIRLDFDLNFVFFTSCC